MKGILLQEIDVLSLQDNTLVYRISKLGEVILEEIKGTKTYNPITQTFTEITDKNTYYSFYKQPHIGEVEIVLKDIKFCLATNLYRISKKKFGRLNNEIID